MRKYIFYMSILTVAAFIAVSVSPMTAGAAELKVKWFGYIQATAGSGDGLTSQDAEDDGLRFGADRIRIGYKVKFGKVFSKLQIDFNKASTSSGAASNDYNILPNIIKDAVVGYKFDGAAKASVGMFKTPVGMDFNTSGTKLDITKRGMEKAFVLERSLGVMLSGRKIGGGFGYDIGVFNPTTRSSAVSGGTKGDQIAYAGRIMYDMNKTLHVQASAGKSEEAGGTGTEDYTVFDVGAIYKINSFTLKAELISASDVKGVKDADELVWYLHAGYMINSNIEGVIRHYSANEEDTTAGTDTELSNTYIGINYFIDPTKKYNARLQLNYVFVSGDEWGYMGDSKGKKDNVILAQYQVKF